MEYVVNQEWLLEQLANKDVKIVDCRFSLSKPDEGERLYKESHIPGAYFFDLEKQLSAPVSKHGGRHPLPDIEQFRHEIEQAGIDNTKTVVAYDGGEGAFASRFWWLLTYIGHDKVYVLNGGFKGWVEAGYPTTKEVPKPESAQYKVSIRKEMLATYEEIKEIVANKKKSPILIDSREKARYLGKEEPIDKIPGHIPGAMHKFWAEGLENGFFKGSEEQKKRFAELDQKEPIIVYCGSGVTATPNYIALKIAGYQNVKLYAGSYSDWVSYSDNPVEKG
ncbi:Thiosulfate sulfurtransferase, rhodanese [Caldibacillus thermoamylovorans]|uniref:Thiosulfate sulfurtransferase, rhodanese n=1 Tax=Caldibacillus thermoamylovorans TaxID=35841 RepID=A0ABD4ABA3_9BACI|nr:sulfurtransferase [Caldibacillus thermoamylovorans]KIO60772.1 Thiosulfate sulfurtransferase, rhodanese [Caldibacillus thermoamylovorans]KIO66170.1 Thiosulfate sulfurtransferase, rhodanese [Caldibacillus thermoamylovorans]KIO74080.1 Thiosulfate sulfurtransferase, rhodanese [Caldibacillus thermoamylovorans]NWN98532.1 sulfurtransferase [Bacillus sp. (in: firmicutes)]